MGDPTLPYWVQALLWGALGLGAYLVLLKRLRRTHRPKDVPEVVLTVEDAPDPSKQGETPAGHSRKPEE